MNRPGKPPSEAAGKRALVVEDNVTNQAVVAAILQSLDFVVSFAFNGEEALDAVSKEKFDVILMDIHMPIMDGFAATRMIRDRGGWCATVPIIAVTANEMASDRSVYIAAGLDDLVPKPVNTRLFAETVLRHVEQTER